MLNVYIFKGTSEVFVPGLGMVKPGQTVETTMEINNGQFEKVENVVKNTKKK